MMKKIGWLATFVMCTGLFACAKPNAVTPTSADATKGMSICWKSAEESASNDDSPTTSSDESAKLRRAIGERLEAAGYALVEKDCDLRLAWAYTTATRNEGSDFRTISVTIKARKEDRILDLVKLHLEPDAAPINQPERVAIPVVNAMNASPRLATYAKEHPHGVTPVSTTTTTSATISTTNNSATKRSNVPAAPTSGASTAKTKKPQTGSNGQTWSFSDDVEDMENSLSPESAP